MSLAPPFRRPGDPPIPKAYGGCGCICHRMAGVKHCVPCCYPGKDDNWLGSEPIMPLEELLDLIDKSEMDPKHDHLNELLEDSDRPDAGKPIC